MKSSFLCLLLAATTVFAQEDKWIAILKSDAPQNEKAAACRELVRVGTRNAVPALAQMLADDKLWHMAIYALEPIPDPSVNEVLRDALGKLKGRPLVGVIGSLAVRKDALSIKPLGQLLTDADPAVAQAAAHALGSIGGDARPVLENALATASQANRFAVCEGLFRYAEGAKTSDATAIYDKVLKLPDLSHHVHVAALKGAIRSRGAKGVPILLETIRKESYVLAAEAARISMDLPGREVTQGLIKELSQADAEKRLLLIQTLGNRGDASASSALVAIAKNGEPNLQIVALRSLVQLRDSSALPVLVSLAKVSNPAVSAAAQYGLVGFPGKEADAAVVSMLSETEPKVRISAIEIVSQRRVASATALLIKAAGDSDDGVAGAGFKALGEIGGVMDIPGVVDAMMRSKATAAAENALAAICARQSDPKTCSEKLLPGFSKAQGEPKLALLRVLRTVGDSQALSAVRSAAEASDKATQDTALRALCDWPNAEALPDLTRIAKTTTDSKFKILSIRGLLRLIPGMTGGDAEKAAQLNEILPMIQRVEEKRLALATMSNLGSAQSLSLVLPYLADEALKEEAADAAVGISQKIVATHPAEVAKALKSVQTSNAKLTERIRQIQGRLPADMK